jgi:hypothetical protein
MTMPHSEQKQLSAKARKVQGKRACFDEAVIETKA